MPDLQYGITTQDRTEGNFPRLPVVNMIAEQVPSEPNVVLQSRPGLTAVSTMGAGPLRQLFNKDGILNSSLFGVSGASLYQSGSKIGDIDGDDYVSLAGFETTLFATGGRSLWGYDGTTLSQILTPDNFEVLHLCVGTSRLIVVDSGTGRFYWSDVLTTNIDALSFATAEASPDKLKHLLFMGDTLILFGTETVEFWVSSASNPDLPYLPVVGRTFSVGIRDTGCATDFNGSFAWITNHNQICLDSPNQTISTPSLDEKLAGSLTAKLWTFNLQGTQFLAVTLDDQTWVLSPSSKTWSLFESYGDTNFVATCAAGDYFGSKNDGSICQWTSDHSDFGGVLERRFCAGLPADGGSLPISRLTLRTNPGQTPFDTGTYANPVVGMKVSRDGGFTWTPYYDRSLGSKGEYRNFCVWRSMGFVGRPGLLVEFRVTDPVPFRVSNVSLNDDYGGV